MSEPASNNNLESIITMAPILEDFVPSHYILSCSRHRQEKQEKEVEKGWKTTPGPPPTPRSPIAGAQVLGQAEQGEREEHRTRWETEVSISGLDLHIYKWVMITEMRLSYSWKRLESCEMRPRCHREYFKELFRRKKRFFPDWISIEVSLFSKFVIKKIFNRLSFLASNLTKMKNKIRPSFDESE